MIEKNFVFYWKIFKATFSLSAFTFGGGYVIVPLMQKKFVEDFKWIEEKEMYDLVSIAQSSPGPIAVNASIIIGYRLGGVLGAIVSLLGAILPPFIILSVVSLFYSSFIENKYVKFAFAGMQAGIAAIIVDVVIKMATNVAKQKKVIYIIIMIAAFIVTYFFKINVMFIMLTCILIGLILNFLDGKDKKVKEGGSDDIS